MCAAYDPVRDRMVIGEGEGQEYFSDMWALTLGGTPNWTELAPTGVPPEGRSGSSMICDPVRDRMVVFGGRGLSTSYFNDVWALMGAGSVPAGVEGASSPAGYLSFPLPNPTRGGVSISFSLARPGRVQVRIYDITGRAMRQLVDGQRRAGTETLRWDGMRESGVPAAPGVYWVRVTGPGLQATRKFVLLK
jgi:hypothetical protein